MLGASLKSTAWFNPKISRNFHCADTIWQVILIPATAIPVLIRQAFYIELDHDFTKDQFFVYPLTCKQIKGIILAHSICVSSGAQHIKSVVEVISIGEPVGGWHLAVRLGRGFPGGCLLCGGRGRGRGTPGVGGGGWGWGSSWKKQSYQWLSTVQTENFFWALGLPASGNLVRWSINDSHQLEGKSERADMAISSEYCSIILHVHPSIIVSMTHNEYIHDKFC